ncbi:hypothetical protein [Nocardioides donggukensis]|uniref:Uncharacterized protein n=1 Tax=Nocardioides donggukensis TaxID=2774019 RepID=A0A927PZC1_9ACTN|nr:hypothetical protein [Nocardioides donggukensis]MBD8869923.1 hypothetical protein [Nocardioides donggukensis]
MNRNATSPWPFVGMAGMAATFFLYAASGLVVPWWAVLLLMALWLVQFVAACRWWTPHPTRVAAVPVVATVLWFGLVTGGAAAFGWSS